MQAETQPFPSSPQSRTGILIIHGMTGTPLEVRPIARILRRYGYRVATPMLCGHGAGHRELLDTTWRDWLAGVRAELDKLSDECDQVYIAGLSASALLATLVSADNPRVCGLILLSVHLGYWRKEGLPWNHFLLPLVIRIPWLRRNAWWTETPPYGIKDVRLQNNITRAIKATKSGESPAHGLFRTYVETIHQANLMIRETLRQAPRVSAPALIVHSMEDTLFSPENATRLYSRLGSSSKRIVLITGCDHVMTVDLRQNDVAQLIYEFVSKTGRFSTAEHLSHA